jgi:hypothetical protein
MQRPASATFPLACGVLAAIGFFLIALDWPRATGKLQEGPRGAVNWVVLAAAGYVLATAAQLFRQAQAAGDDRAAPSSWLSLAAHLATLAISVWVSLRGSHSMALLKGFDLTLATLITVAALGIASWGADRWGAGPSADAPPPRPARAIERWLPLLQLACCAALVAAVVNLERQPLPFSTPRKGSPKLSLNAADKNVCATDRRLSLRERAFFRGAKDDHHFDVV